MAVRGALPNGGVAADNGQEVTIAANQQTKDQLDVVHVED